MSQDRSQISTEPPLPGVTVVQQINQALQAIGTNFAGADDPAALAWPFSTWADTGNERIKRRNAAGAAWVDCGPLFPVSESGGSWASMPVGVPLPLMYQPATLPPTNNPAYRYITLTASDPYNAGVLVSESVTGSAPTITASAVVSLAGSPLNGVKIYLLNTEKTFIRPGTDTSQALANSTNASHSHTGTVSPSLVLAQGAAGSILATQSSGTPVNYSTVTSVAIAANGGTEAAPRHRISNYIMRIL